MENKKEKLTKNQFAELLYLILSLYMTQKPIEKRAKELGFEIKDNEDWGKIFDELLILDMWLTMYAFDELSADENTIEECLDMFDLLVYNRFYKYWKEKKKLNVMDFNEWRITSIAPRYIEYSNAMETEFNIHQGPSWAVATSFNKRLFGELKEDYFVQAAIVIHIDLFIKHFGGIYKQCII
jgi:hypothetical protein